MINRVRPIIYCLFLLSTIFSTQRVNGQSPGRQHVTVERSPGTVGALLRSLNASINEKIYSPEEYLALPVSELPQGPVLLDSLLTYALEPNSLQVLWHRNSIGIIIERSELTKVYGAEYFQALEESVEVSKSDAIQEQVIGSIDNISLSGELVLSGVIIDEETEEPVIGATIIIEGSNAGTATEVDGSYALSLSSGSHMLSVQYVGYTIRRIPIKVISSGTLDIRLSRSTVLLDEVVVQARAQDANVQSTQVGVTSVSTKKIEKLPAFLGEVDIIKGLLLQPGVSNIGEGSSGFNVRGGNVDQNLIMIDEGMIFNASHALGFFSSFNSDIVSEAILYKGTMPATFGGRLASALDVKVRDGSFDKWHMKGGLGVVSSRFNIDGPIKKDKTSILLSGRSTYSNWVLDLVKNPEVNNSSAYFYDVNMRLAHRFNEKNNLTISAYASDDQFSFNEAFGFDYQTIMAQGQYRKVIGENILSTTNVVWSTYDSQQDDLNGRDASRYDTGLEYVKLKENLNYLGEQFQANAGLSAIHYRTKGNEINPTDPISLIESNALQDQKGIEWGLYGDFAYELSPRFSMTGGLRYSVFNFLGPYDTYLYQNPNLPREEDIIEPTRIEKSIVESFHHLQPRLSLRYNLTANSSLKAGYGRTVQYINQIFNSESPTPTNFWQLSNTYIKPQLAHNFSLGYFHNFNQNLWITSIEGFYRNIDQLFDYIDFANLLVNDHLETELLPGIGRTYGLELSINKQVGLVHGWLSYTYSRSERKIEGINRGEWYLSNFDKPHDLSLVTNFQINKRNSISLNFTYGTGRPITVPVNKHVVQNRIVVLSYSDRNAFRIPNYHRLDLSYSLAQGFRKSKRFKTSWTFSVYNLYGRKNPYSVFIEQNSDGGTSINRLSILGSAFPALTFNFELL